MSSFTYDLPPGVLDALASARGAQEPDQETCINEMLVQPQRRDMQLLTGSSSVHSLYASSEAGDLDDPSAYACLAGHGITAVNPI